ncbi:MAG: epoxyqueuosine reductase QueH [Lysobacterales bacterium]|nr:MAG: epoxyqueuosine reductase QueH [Xanthomonadales bacterium]
MCKPSLLLHICCGPCAAHAVEAVRSAYDITGFFSNSNIHPAREYHRRLAEARKLAGLACISLVEDAYCHEEWRAAARGLEDEPERGRRCAVCFRFSLARTARYAVDHGFDRFTSTLTISPHKNSAMIFEIGRSLGPFLDVDFKKQDGFRKSVALSHAYGLYRQNYCGCEFSFHEPAPQPGPTHVTPL